MKSAQLGNNIFPAEVTNISSNGIWMLSDSREMFLAFEHFPWFQEASIKSKPAENRMTLVPIISVGTDTLHTQD